MHERIRRSQSRVDAGAIGFHLTVCSDQPHVGHVDLEIHTRPIPVSGGRDEGYRGFSVKTALQPGDWRCDVKTAQGALIGRTSFTVTAASSTPTLSQTVL